MAEVTVVLTLYNKEKFVNSAIESVFRQTYKNWHLLIIDDASTDRSAEIVRSYLPHKKITFLQLRRNLRQARVLNYALTKVKTPYLIQLDADDWFEESTLQTMVHQAKQRPDAGLIYANHYAYYYDEQDQFVKREEVRLEPYQDEYDLMKKINMAMVPRFFWTAKLKHVGGWLAQNEGDMIVDDVQIAFRLARQYPLIWMDQFLYHRRKYAANMQKFEQTKPMRVKYRYDLYNQLLREWGEEYVANWQDINGNKYLVSIEKNPSYKFKPDLRYTIVIPNYNHAPTVIQAIRSALDQRLQPEKVLIIDDQSTDQSESVIRDQVKSNKIQFYQMKKNSGISTVLNTALKQIQTPYFIQLDSDDWLDPNAARKLVQGLAAQPNAGISYANHYLWRENDSGELVKKQEVIQPTFANKYDWLLKLGYMVNPRCYRTSAVRAVGGWIIDDPWKGRYYEDARMVLRLVARFGWVHVPEFLHNVRHDVNRSSAKIKYYNHLRKTFYEKLLQEWGNEYKPIWETAPTGRIVLKELNRL
ncbi:family 2 glycosyl transferase [Gracilibacillus halophilus YIM-C55.5]|uniref:Family 2 glycosyl transferase n=1 Tax=Gracilibacillus halophilus YIM-C55.5 TaxID=1308866 RepID=N4WBI9_9BACI|nr:glycosyltransferase family A protein [Gracilibacillus halophilus]ENH96604.1 family 2 glycosyl transferase [Gracilibacillus halophilus YIM-C55.5]